MEAQNIINLGYDYQKLRSTLRGWLEGRRYYTALKAMDLGLSVHTGLRKDGKTPEFSHQVFQAQFARSIEPLLANPEVILAIIFLHDCTEDRGVSESRVYNEFGPDIGRGTELMTNAVCKVRKPLPEYYGAIGTDINASICKGIDWIHNNQSMPGVFTIEKQGERLRNLDEHVLPMLKAARKRFPEQIGAYHTIKHVLLTQAELIRIHHETTFQYVDQISKLEADKNELHQLNDANRNRATIATEFLGKLTSHLRTWEGRGRIPGDIPELMEAAENWMAAGRTIS